LVGSKDVQTCGSICLYLGDILKTYEVRHCLWQLTASILYGLTEVKPAFIPLSYGAINHKRDKKHIDFLASTGQNVAREQLQPTFQPANMPQVHCTHACY